MAPQQRYDYEYPSDFDPSSQVEGRVDPSEDPYGFQRKLQRFMMERGIPITTRNLNLATSALVDQNRRDAGLAPFEDSNIDVYPPEAQEQESTALDAQADDGVVALAGEPESQPSQRDYQTPEERKRSRGRPIPLAERGAELEPSSRGESGDTVGETNGDLIDRLAAKYGDGVGEGEGEDDDFGIWDVLKSLMLAGAGARPPRRVRGGPETPEAITDTRGKVQIEGPDKFTTDVEPAQRQIPRKKVSLQFIHPDASAVVAGRGNPRGEQSGIAGRQPESARAQMPTSNELRPQIAQAFEDRDLKALARLGGDAEAAGDVDSARLARQLYLHVQKMGFGQGELTRSLANRASRAARAVR